MPIYEYRCRRCRGRFQVLVLRYDALEEKERELRCPRCKSREWERLISRFSVAQSEEELLERLADPAQFADLDENDPKSIARWAKRFGKQFGEELGDDWEEMVDQMLEEELAGEGEEGGRETAGDDLGWA